MPDILHLAIPGFVLLLLAEVIFDTIGKRELFETKDTFSSLAMGIGNVLVVLAQKGLFLQSTCGYISLESLPWMEPDTNVVEQH